MPTRYPRPADKIPAALTSADAPQLTALVLLVFCALVQTAASRVNLSPGLRTVAVCSVIGLLFGFIIGFFGFFLALIPPLKPLFRWAVQRSVFLTACLVTLVALAYAVENWRGKRAWEDFKREAAAKGELFEVKNIIPPSVPDEENVVATPLFQPLCNEFDTEWRKLHTGPNGLTNEADRLKLDLGRKNDPWPDNESANWMIGRRTDLKAWQGEFRTEAQDLELHHPHLGHLSTSAPRAPSGSS